MGNEPRVADERDVALALLASTGLTFAEGVPDPAADEVGADAGWRFETAGGAVRADVYVCLDASGREALVRHLLGSRPVDDEFPMISTNGALAYRVTCAGDAQDDSCWTGRAVAGALGGEEE